VNDDLEELSCFGLERQGLDGGAHPAILRAARLRPICTNAELRLASPRAPAPARTRPHLRYGFGIRSVALIIALPLIP
jgi:hypothetical protein